jgi:hypothetical protein
MTNRNTYWYIVRTAPVHRITAMTRRQRRRSPNALTEQSARPARLYDRVEFEVMNALYTA